MPRKAKKTEVLQTGNYRENVLEHRNFLARALARNDTEMTALINLNESLQKAKEAILQSCGELVLLDLGAGRLTLINDELHEEKTEMDDEVHHLSPAQNDLCVNFLLRMKLRRKLSNRLARRLNRIAHAMDGEDVAPPPPPRYGDLSLNIDPEAVKAKEAHWKLLQEAKERLAKAKLEAEKEAEKETKEVAKTEADSDIKDEASSSEDKDKMEQDGEEPNKEEETNEQKEVEVEAKAKEESFEQAQSQEVAGNVPPEKKEADASDQEASTDMAPASSETKPSEKEPDETESSEQKKSDDKDNEPTDPVSSLDGEPTDSVSSLERDIEILKEYESAYERIYDSKTKSFKYSILKDKMEPDYHAVQGIGIGSTSRPMSAEERELEHQRWQMAILARIPHQPTFEEVGRNNQVFCFEERRKRCLEEVDHDGDAEETEEPEEKKIKEDSGENSDAMDVEKDSEQAAVKTNEEDEDEDNDNDDKKSENKSEKNTKSPEKQKEAIKEIRPMSLAAVPSFHDQDMKRLLSIHFDLVKQSIDELARTKLAKSTEKYNNAIYLSITLSNRRQQLHTQLAISVDKGRREVAKSTSDYSLNLTIAKQKWLKEKQEHDAKRLKNSLPSSYGQMPMGTVAIQNFCRNPNKPNALVIGSCLADIVDATVMTSEGKLSGNTKFADFVSPASPTVPQQRLQEQAAIKKEGAKMLSQLTQSEEARKFAWKSFMKLKGDIELKYGMVSRRTAASYINLPVPVLNRATQQVVPKLNYALPTNAGYTPSRPPSSDPKYSTAQVRKRIGNDGTVAPVSEPKKTRDGLYMRPAGRQRKGMQWDSLRGIWVPEAQMS